MTMHAGVRWSLLAALTGVTLAGSLPGRTAEKAAAPEEVRPTDPHIRYIGRFDTAAKWGPRCSWSASTVQLRFSGTGLDATIGETGNDRLQVVVDGRPTRVLTTKPGSAVYHVASGLAAGTHQVWLVKRTEPFMGITQFLGFRLSTGGKILDLPPRSQRRIEVIGDSITCGYGNEGSNQNEPYSADTENAYQTYGAIAARSLGAEYVCVAWSGRKMWPDNTVAEIYDRTLPTDAQSRWDPSQWVPDVVVINLATNDFSKDNPDQAGWTRAYEEFVARLRKQYPKAMIYCATGSMMTDGYPSGHRALSTAKGYLDQVVADAQKTGDNKVRRVDFATQDPKNGIGASWHPSVRTHEIMADVLTKALQHDLGWIGPAR